MRGGLESMGSRYFSPADLQFFSGYPDPNIPTDVRATDRDRPLHRHRPRGIEGGSSRVRTVPELCRKRRQLLTTRDNRTEAQVQQPQRPRGLLSSAVHPAIRT